MWLQVFNLQERQDEILSPQDDKMKSCRHKRHDDIVSPRNTHDDIVLARGGQDAFRTQTPDPVSPRLVGTHTLQCPRATSPYNVYSTSG